MDPEQTAHAFVAHATVLLAVNLIHEMDPVLAHLMSEPVPEADELLNEAVLLDQAIRAPRGDARLERAVQWFDSVWFELTDRESVKPRIRAELDRQRDTPAIFDLEDALGQAADLLDPLVVQTGFFRDVSGPKAVLAAVRHWQADPTRDNLLLLERRCADVNEPPELPSTEVIQRIRFFAREGSLLAGDYVSLHFNPSELLGWNFDELCTLLRSRYPLLRRCDVRRLVDGMLAHHAA